MLGATEDGLGRFQDFVLPESVNRKNESLSVFFKTRLLGEFPMLTSEGSKNPTILGLHHGQCWTLLLNKTLKCRHLPSISRPAEQQFERCLLEWYLWYKPLLLVKQLYQLGLKRLHLDSSSLSASDFLQIARLLHNHVHAHASLFNWCHQQVKHRLRVLFKSDYRCLKWFLDSIVHLLGILHAVTHTALWSFLKAS